MTAEQKAAVRAVWIPGILVLLLALFVGATKMQSNGSLDLGGSDLNDWSSQVMFNSGILAIALCYFTLPIDGPELFVVILLALLLEGKIWSHRPEDWDAWKRIYRIGFGIGVAATFGLLYRLARGKGDQRMYAGSMLVIACTMLLFPSVSMYFHRLVVRCCPLTFDGNAYTIDGTFGFQPAQWVCLLMKSSHFTDDAMYWLYQELPILMMIGVLLSLHYPRRTYPNVLLTFIAMGLASYLSYSVCPMVGINLWVGNEHWPHGPLPATHDLQPWAEPDGWTRNCFPSMHMAWMLGIYLGVRRVHPIVRIPYLACAIGMIGSTLDIGCHYAVDLLGSFPWVVAWLAIMATTAPLRIRLQTLAGAAALFACVIGLLRFSPLTLGDHPAFTIVFVPAIIAGSLLLEHRLANAAIVYRKGEKAQDPGAAATSTPLEQVA